jgi:hypothetical protein
VAQTIHGSPDRVKLAMNNFVYTVGVSYLPLREEAMVAARAIGTIEISGGKTGGGILSAAEEIQRAADNGRLGFKRKYVRC